MLDSDHSKRAASFEMPCVKDPVLPIELCTLQSLGSHFCDVENSEALVCDRNRTL